MHPNYRWRWPAARMAAPFLAVALCDGLALRTSFVTTPAIPIKQC